MEDEGPETHRLADSSNAADQNQHRTSGRRREGSELEHQAPCRRDEWLPLPHRARAHARRGSLVRPTQPATRHGSGCGGGSRPWLMKLASDSASTGNLASAAHPNFSAMRPSRPLSGRRTASDRSDRAPQPPPPIRDASDGSDANYAGRNTSTGGLSNETIGARRGSVASIRPPARKLPRSGRRGAKNARSRGPAARGPMATWRAGSPTARSSPSPSAWRPPRGQLASVAFRRNCSCQRSTLSG